MTKLLKVELSNNHMRRIYSEGKKWPKTLTHLNLANNSLLVLPTIPKNVELFNLTGNPIYCHCTPTDFDFSLYSYSTFCNVKFSCQSYYFDNTKRTCENEIYVKTFWSEFQMSNKCQEPKLERFTLFFGESPRIVCETTGYPVPKIILRYQTGWPKIGSTGPVFQWCQCMTSAMVPILIGSIEMEMEILHLDQEIQVTT